MLLLLSLVKSVDDHVLFDTFAIFAELFVVKADGADLHLVRLVEVRPGSVDDLDIVFLRACPHKIRYMTINAILFVLIE